MTTKDETIADNTAAIMDMLDKSDPIYKQKGDLIRLILDLVWTGGRLERGEEISKILEARL